MTQENTQTKEEVTEEVIDENTSAETKTTGNKDVDSSKAKHIPYDRFKAKVDEANDLKAKLAEFETTQAEEERKRLEEQQNYKELYELEKQKVAQERQVSISIKKGALLAQAGYNEEQAKLLVKLVDGEDDEAIAESIKLLQATVPTQDNYADPSAFNGAKAKPEAVDKEDVGRNAVNRVLNKIRL